MKDLKEILQGLKDGKSLELETWKNQYGERITAKELFFKDGQWMIWEINCWNSSCYGLGTCQCHSHQPDHEHQTTRENALELIREYLEKQNRVTEKRLEETAFLNALIEAVDIKKIRRRIEDALRKGSPAKIMEVAQLLDVKII